MSQWRSIESDPPRDDGDYLVAWPVTSSDSMAVMVDTFIDGDWFANNPGVPDHELWCHIPELPAGKTLI